MTVNHVAIAVPNIARFLDDNAAVYATFSRGPLIVNDVQDVRQIFITDGTVVLELLEPISATSPITGFLKKNRGGGLIHIAYDVEVLDAAIEAVERAGGRVVVDPVPDIAFEQRRIAFLMLNGQVFEFIEAKRPPA
jgi:methylmalonyl-CoA/ethylmalonyl-CoA epimerase